jgi:squalene-associated FAD-dependent desaturase
VTELPSLHHIAVIGAGWSGCAAATELASSGYRVSLFESSRIPGGRARRVETDGQILDNGQHILLAGYRESLRLMKKVGVDVNAAFMRLPLQIAYPPDSNDISFVTPFLPAPFHLLIALLRPNGLQMADKLTLARCISAMRWMDWQLSEDCPVTHLLEQLGQSPRLYQLLWRPLCLSALNTPPDEASANIFLRVLRDSIGGKRADSDMLIPKTDLSALFPEKAIHFIEARHGQFHGGRTVRALHKHHAGWLVDNTLFDAVILATSARSAQQLIRRQARIPELDAFRFESIHTCYLGYAPSVRLSRPFLALRDNPRDNHWGQFVFDHGWLHPTRAGIFAVVISASSSVADIPRKTLESAIAQQLAKACRMPALATPSWSYTLSERDATFFCYPGIVRPSCQTELDGLFLAGDYVHGNYPATLESAVQNGVNAAKQVIWSLHGKTSAESARTALPC